MKISSNDCIFKEDFFDCTSPSSCLRNSEVKLTRLLDTLVFILCRLPSVIAPTSPPGVAVTPLDRVTITVPDAEVANQTSNVAGLVTNSITLYYSLLSQSLSIMLRLLPSRNIAKVFIGSMDLAYT